MARLLVAGATGHLGQHIVKELKKRNHWVRALTRNPIRPFEIADEVVGGNLNRISSLHAACGDIDIVISAAGSSVSPSISKKEPDYQSVDYWGNKNLLSVAGNSGIKHFIYISVYNTPQIQNLDYVRAHTRFADELAHSGLSYAIIQPTGFFSAFDTILDIARSGIAPLIGNGLARTNPIHEKDVAKICVEALGIKNERISVGGPKVYTRKSIFEHAFKALGKKPRFIKLSSMMISAPQKVVSMFDPRLAQLTAFLQAVSEVDVIAPTYGTHRLEDYFSSLISTPA